MKLAFILLDLCLVCLKRLKLWFYVDDVKAVDSWFQVDVFGRVVASQRAGKGQEDKGYRIYWWPFNPCQRSKRCLDASFSLTLLLEKQGHLLNSE